MNYTINPKDYFIMIVDDENIIRMMTEEMLKDLGYNVIGFESPTAAIDYYRDHYCEIDLVILDMMMPEYNGAEVYYMMNKVNPFMKAVVLSGYDGVEQKYHHLLDDGLCCFLIKPMDGQALDNKIKEILLKSFTIDKVAGLSTLLNRESIHNRLLETYYEENKNLDEKILKLIQENNVDGIELLIHKIKGISLNLSSKETYVLSKDLNRKLRDNDYEIGDIIYFIKHHYILLKDIERLLRKANVQKC